MLGILRGCQICAFRREQERKARRKQFSQLVDAIWYSNVQQVVRILAWDPTLLDYRRFVFHLPDKKTTSIIEYAKVASNNTIVQILEGFANFAEREE